MCFCVKCSQLQDIASFRECYLLLISLLVVCTVALVCRVLIKKICYKQMFFCSIHCYYPRECLMLISFHQFFRERQLYKTLKLMTPFLSVSIPNKSCEERLLDHPTILYESNFLCHLTLRVDFAAVIELRALAYARVDWSSIPNRLPPLMYARAHAS